MHQSFLDCHQDFAEFHGVLDIKTLGGAGFASQRTVGDDREWDLSKYAGITITIVNADDKRYTLILKDALLPRDPDTGRDQATISWEYDFKVESTVSSSTRDDHVFVAWDSFKPTYRGREKTGAKPIDLKHVKRVSIMNRR